MEMLSIIVPVYNVERYLKECIESILEQTYTNKEIILVDDGSTDNSGKICDEFAENHDDVKVIHQKNRGLPYARNAGLEIAEGTYAAFVDSDDVVKSEMYEKMISALEASDADMAVCNLEVFNKNGVRAVSARYHTELIQHSIENIEQFYDFALDSSCNKVYKCEIIKKNQLFFMDKSIVAQEDFWFLIRYCSHISRIVSLEDSLYKYRDRKSSITKSGVDRDITDRCIRFIELVSEYMNTVNREGKTFLSKMTYDMLFATINQMQDVTPFGIRNVIRKFSKTPYYKEMLLCQKVNVFNIRGFYDAFKIQLLRYRLYFIFSCCEYLRVKRLYKKICSDDCFE